VFFDIGIFVKKYIDIHPRGNLYLCFTAESDPVTYKSADIDINL